MQRFRDLQLVDLGPVGECGVDELDTELDCAPEHAECVLVRLGPAENVRAAEAHCAEAEPSDAEIAADDEGGIHHGIVAGGGPAPVELRVMPDDVDRSALLTTLTTEHFTLQGARGTTVAESSARGAMYLGTLSASLVSLGFIGQLSARGETFRVFALVVLPTVFLLGVFTFVRLVESSVEDIFYGRAINRIRSYYLEQAGPERRWFMLGGHDDALGVLRNMGLSPAKWQMYFTAASAIAVVNSVVGGAALGLACWVAFDAELAVTASIGAAFAVVTLGALFRWSRRRLEAGVASEVLFPSPSP
jgi:hypothetical protein